MASMDSSLAGWMKLHVFTTSTSAASGSRTSSCPRRASTPSITSPSTRFLGHPRVRRWTRRGSVTEVRELHGDAEVALAQELDDRLQLVLLLARDPHLIALDGDLHLELGVLHQLHDLARLVGRDTLLEVDALLGGAGGPGLRGAELERPERHLPPPHLLAQDVGERTQLEVVGGVQVDGRLLAPHLGRLVLEIEALCDLAQRLLDRVVDLLEIDAADHVEGRHFGGPSIGGGADHVNPGRGRETEERAVEGDVAALVREGDARRRTERIGDARLLDRGVGLAHHERERADAGVLAWHQVEHPARGLVALEARLEVALDAPEAAEKADRRTRLERLGERRLDHLLLLGLVDPERLAVADDELAVGRRVVPTHAVRLLEGDRAVRLERRAERRRLDRLAEVGGEGAGGLVAALEAGEGVPERVVRGRAGRERQREKDRQGDPHARPPSFTVSRSPRKRSAARSTPVPRPARAGIRGRAGDEGAVCEETPVPRRPRPRASVAGGHRAEEDVQLGRLVPGEAVPLAAAGEIDDVDGVAREPVVDHTVPVGPGVDLERRVRARLGPAGAEVDERQARELVR